VSREVPKDACAIVIFPSSEGASAYVAIILPEGAHPRLDGMLLNEVEDVIFVERPGRAVRVSEMTEEEQTCVPATVLAASDMLAAYQEARTYDDWDGEDEP
jgi:hypothetical protein